MKTVKAIGQRGSWFAKVEGERLPCVHKHWIRGLDHHDPFRRHGDSDEKILQLVEGIKSAGRVTTDDPSIGDNGEVQGFSRTGYVAVYRVEDVTYGSEDGLRFRLAERLLNLI